MSFDAFTTELSNGVKVPLLGLGTSKAGGYCHDTIIYALKDCNYRLIDTAQRYGCEENLGQALKESGIPRNEIFLTSKVWPTDYGYHKTVEAFHESMKKLGVDYLDLYLMHWPLIPTVPCAKKVLEESWRALEKLYDSGLCRAIGVSNYALDNLEDLLSTASVTPHVNQVEFHPYQNIYEIRNFCKDKRINIEGYSPFARGKLLSKKSILEIASQYNKTPSQILVKWSMQVYSISFVLQNGVITIPKSIKKERVLENSQVYDFTLNQSTMATLDSFPIQPPMFENFAEGLTEQLFPSSSQ
ncbi:putative oxidoreductase [Nymphon striatum]|nr:putative oxidoreductase [Nymphon striatum]KAG1676317.1 putative oxidoreductase [Nymphon striatum]